MKGFAITHKGCEEFCAKEIEEKLKVKCEIGKAIVFFNVKDALDLCRLCYTGQSVIRTGIFLGKGKISQLEKTDIDFSQHLNEEDSFKVETFKIDELKLKTKVEEDLGGIIIKNVEKNKKYRQKVSLSNPTIIFLCILSEEGYFIGIDFAGIDLSKRDYKIFTNPSSLKGTVCFSLLKFAEYNPKESVVDVMSGDGTMMIEAGLYASKFPVNFFQKERLAFNRLPFVERIRIKKMHDEVDKKADKDEKQILGLDNSLRNAKSARKNAKIAGINKTINFSKIDIDWLDIKLKEKSVDKIISQLPSPSRNTDENELKKKYDELFYQADYILKKNGTIAAVMRKKELAVESAKKYGFIVYKEKEVWTGEQMLYFLNLVKK